MKCLICDSTNLELAIDLGNQPWCNHFLKEKEIGTEPYYPLRVVHCQDCETAQLDYTVAKTIMFGDHTYLSGVTKSLSEHFKNVAHEVDERFSPDAEGKSVLDIGSNDGTQLKHFQDVEKEFLELSHKVEKEIKEGEHLLAEMIEKTEIPESKQKFQHLLDILGPPLDHKHLKAHVMVDVDVGGRRDEMMVLVLKVGQPVAQMAVVMLVDQGQCPDDRALVDQKAAYGRIRPAGTQGALGQNQSLSHELDIRLGERLPGGGKIRIRWCLGH